VAASSASPPAGVVQPLPLPLQQQDSLTRAFCFETDRFDMNGRQIEKRLSKEFVFSHGRRWVVVIDRCGDDNEREQSRSLIARSGSEAGAVMKNCHKSFKHFGGAKAMRPISKSVRAHAVSLVMKMPVGPLLRLSDDEFDALVYVWFEQPPHDTLKDLGLIMATFERLLAHLQALRNRRVVHCGDNRNGIQDDLGNIMSIACGNRINYQPEWAEPPPKAKTDAKVGRNVRPRMEALPAPDPVFAIGDEVPQVGDLRAVVCSCTGRPKIVSVVSGRWAFAGHANQAAAIVVENGISTLKIFDSALSNAAAYNVPLQTFVQILAVWHTAEETPQPVINDIRQIVQNHGHVHARVQPVAAPPQVPLHLQRARPPARPPPPPLQGPVQLQHVADARTAEDAHDAPAEDVSDDGNETDDDAYSAVAAVEARSALREPLFIVPKAPLM
jgi:hypothetical protein